MALQNAIGAITLDICDTTGCEELSEWFKAKNKKVDLMYLSNIGHYLDWSDEKLQKANLEEGAVARDFCGRIILSDQWELAASNLRMLTYDKTGIIRFDNVSGGRRWNQFRPSFDIPDDLSELKLPTPKMQNGLTSENVQKVSANPPPTRAL